MSSSAAGNNELSLLAATTNFTNDVTTTTTTDCPICLCSITSKPWGVVNPCGHPYHSECWAEVFTNHAAAGGGGRNTTCALCTICKGKTGGFVPVFVDLNNNHDGDYGGGGGGGGGGGREGASWVTRNGGEGDEDEGDEDSLKKLMDEWEKLWKELEKLSGNEYADEDVGDVDGNLTARSDRRDVASICVPIDLTQRTLPMHGVVDWIRSSFAPSHAAQIQKLKRSE